MLRRLHELRPSGLARRYFSSPLNVPPRPHLFRDVTSPLYISEAYWNGLDPVLRLNLTWIPNTNSGVQLWNIVREEAFAPNPPSTTDGKRNFGDLWLQPLEEAEVKRRIQQTPPLRSHPKSEHFLGGTVFWDDDASTSVTGRCKFIGNHTFPVELQPVGPGARSVGKCLWDSLKHDGRVAIVRGVSGSGKTVALLHHPPEANMVTFYFNAHSLLERRDDGGQLFSTYFVDGPIDTAHKSRRDTAVASAVVKGVRSLLGGMHCSPDPSVNVLVAIDEAGTHAEFVRALCSCSADIQKELREQLGTPNVFIAVAGTGVETSALAPGSENERYRMLQPITPVWDGLCRCLPEVKCVLPRDPRDDTRVHKLARAFVGHARAAWALATVLRSRNTLKMTVENTLATSALLDLCGEAARLLRSQNSLERVPEQSLPYLFVHAAFLQCQITPLVKSDFLVASKYGVICDTAKVMGNKAPLPVLPRGRELAAQEARLESTEDKAYVEEELRRFEMPATFTAWLHFSLGFGMQSPASDGLEELTAQFAALALIARKESYFTPAYWDVVERRTALKTSWKVPFRLFDVLSQLPGRDSLAAVEIFHLGTRFDAAGVAAEKSELRRTDHDFLEAVKASLIDTPSPTKPGQRPKSHKVVINGPMSEFADLLVFPQSARRLCLIQCKGSDKVDDAAGSRFGLRDLFTELYKMGCEDDMSCLAGCLNAAQRSSAPKWKELHGVVEFAMAACIEAGEYEVAFALGTQIVAERALFAKCSPAQQRDLQPLIDARNAADGDLLTNLRKMRMEDLMKKLSNIESENSTFPDFTSNEAHHGDAYDVLKSALEAQTKTLTALNNSEGTAAVPLTRALSVVATFNPIFNVGASLKRTLFRPTQSPHPPFWRRTSAPNPKAVLLDALLRTAACDSVERVVLVWGRPVEAVPAWSVPQGCTLVQAGPWDGKTWPPTNLYPLMEPTANDRRATMIGPAGDFLPRSEWLLLP